MVNVTYPYRLIPYGYSHPITLPIHLSDARHFEPSAVLMHLCAQLLDLHPSPAPRHLRQQRMALLVAGSAALEVRYGSHTGCQRLQPPPHEARSLQFPFLHQPGVFWENRSHSLSGSVASADMYQRAACFAWEGMNSPTCLPRLSSPSPSAAAPLPPARCTRRGMPGNVPTA